MSTPRDQHPSPPDWQLREELRAVDPARDLPPASTEWLARVRDAAQQTPGSRWHASGRTEPVWKRRRHRVLVSAATAAGIIAIAAAVGLPATQSATVLTGPTGTGGVAAICAPIDVTTLRQADSAFAAEVVAVGDGRARLAVTDRYRGTVSTRVEVPYAPDQPLELSIGPLAVGQRVLIASTDDTVRTCGQSGPATPELTTLYEQAFG